MSISDEVESRFELQYDADAYRRWVCGKEVIIHCHHYNSRIQHTIEGSSEVDGKAIIRGTSEAVFAEQIANVIKGEDSEQTKLSVAKGLYANLGYGQLDFSKMNSGEITAPTSHFVEGWNASFSGRDAPVCTFTEGYLQGALHAALGKRARVREVECMVLGAPTCRFAIDWSREEPIEVYTRVDPVFKPQNGEGFLHSSTVDEQKILSALVEMPFVGNDEGIIPAFGVYLANTPADFYNLAAIRFVEEMKSQGMFDTAKKLLTYDAETCGMNTFRGIMDSPEWEALIGPMIKEKDDNLHGIITVSNGLGWGNWHVRELVSGSSLVMESLNGYEALGFKGYRGVAAEPQCFMLTGVAAGIMELIYGEGSIEKRFGTFSSKEENCICASQPSCTFSVEKL